MSQPDLRYTHLSTSDAEALAHLHKVIAEADGALWPPTVSEIRQELLPSPTFDPSSDSWAVWAGADLVAFAHVLVRPTLSYDGDNNIYVLGGVHPDWQGQGIGSKLLTLGEERGRAKGLALHPDARAVLNAFSTATAPAAESLLTNSGYEITRYWFDMIHDLSGEFAEDFRTQPMTSDLFEATRVAHNDAFATHWGSGPITKDGWEKRTTSSPDFRPDLSRIVVHEGEVLAYAVVSAPAPGEAYFDLIGVRGKAQRQGLGRAVLSSGLAAIKADGSFHEAGLDVDADNPSGAGGLYRAAGFTEAARKLTWQKPAG